MQKTSKIKEFTFYREWTGDNGTVYYYNLVLENNDIGQFGTTKKNPEIKIGDTISYTIESTDKGNKIKLYKNQEDRYNKNKYVEPFEHKAAGMAMGYVKDLIIADKLRIESLEQSFYKIYNLIISKKQ